MPSKLAKISGLLTPHQETILERFLGEYQTTKAKAMGMLLELWENSDYPMIPNQTIQRDDLESVVNRLLDEKLKTIIPNLTNLVANHTEKPPVEIIPTKEDSNLSYPVANHTDLTEDEGIRQPEITPNQDEVSISSYPITNQEEEIEVKKDDLNPYVKSLETAIDVPSEEVEEDIKPIDEDVEVITPKPDNNGKNEQITEDVEDIKTLTQALDEVILKHRGKDDPEWGKMTKKEKEDKNKPILEELEGKYYTSIKGGGNTKWTGSYIERAIKYRKEGKA